MRDRIFYAACFGFGLGVLLRSFVWVNFYLAATFGLISFASILFFGLVSNHKWGIIAGVFVLAISLGIFRFHLADQSPSLLFEREVNQRISLFGTIIDEPSIGENSQKLTIGIQMGRDKTKILTTVNLDNDFQYGDQVNFSGELKKPENFITDQGKEFDYFNYLKKDGIFYTMSYPKVEIISRGNGNKVKSALLSIKEKFLETINFAVSSPESLLLGGLILGEKASFGRELRQSFVDTGTIHIVALSGYNVMIVAEWFMKLFKFLSQTLGISVGVLLIWLFILMTGGSSTAIRAGIMATLALLARATGRNYDVARALTLAGVFMILLNPFVLAYDVSFQLSFIATIAVIFFAPRIEKYFWQVTNSFELRDIISVTCAAYIFVLPFILYKMGNLSLVALPANILILPFIPLTMFLGFLTGFAGFVWSQLALPFGYLSHWILHYELGVIDFFSDFSFAIFTLPNFPLVLALLIYTYFVYKLFARNIKDFFTAPF